MHALLYDNRRGTRADQDVGDDLRMRRYSQRGSKSGRNLRAIKKVRMQREGLLAYDDCSF